MRVLAIQLPMCVTVQVAVWLLATPSAVRLATVLAILPTVSVTMLVMLLVTAASIRRASA